MHAGEPYLLDVLRFGMCVVEAVELEGLRLVPLLQAKHRAPLVDRDRLPERLDARIFQRVGELLETRPIEAIRPRHDHAGDGVPDPDETYQRPPRRGDARELRRLVVFRGRQRPFGIAGIGDLLEVEAEAML